MLDLQVYMYWEEYLYWQTQDKKTLKRINSLLQSIDRNGYKCIGKPEPLSENLSRFGKIRIQLLEQGLLIDRFKQIVYGA